MTQSINLHRLFFAGNLQRLSAARTTYHLRDDVLIRYPFLHYNALNKELVLAVVVLRDLLGRLHRNYTDRATMPGEFGASIKINSGTSNFFSNES
jgi:hypothetical protein